MKYLSADRIHNGFKWLASGTIIEVGNNGTIEAVHTPGSIPQDKVQHYSGIICPGFVNTHCHLELSYLKGAIAEGNQLISFLQSVMANRSQSNIEEREEALKVAIMNMRENGVVAVGDIANTIDMLPYRAHAGFHIHTFVESLGFIESKAEERFTISTEVYHQYREQEAKDYILRQSIVPHAPYSVSSCLFELIDNFEPTALISIHNEETEAENDFYRDKNGDMFHLYRSMNIDVSSFQSSGKTSLQTYLPQLSKTHQFILVHNTFMSEDDIAFIKNSGYNTFLCLCPNANWYIERKLPPVILFKNSNLPICLGTDSLASNYELNIWGEVQMLQKHFPEIELEQLLCWATYNGAKALRMDDIIGSIEPGKKPGIVHIDNDSKITVLA